MNKASSKIGQPLQARHKSACRFEYSCGISLEWEIVAKRQISQFSSTSWREQVTLNDDDVCFVRNQHAQLDLYSASSQKQHSAVYMLLHSHTLFWFRATQSWLLLLKALCLAENQQIPSLLSLMWSERGFNPQSTTSSRRTRQPLMWLYISLV